VKVFCSGQEIGWEDHLKRPVEWVVNHIISAAAP